MSCHVMSFYVPYFSDLSYYDCTGANYGQGKGLRGKGLSTFTCGVKDTTSGNANASARLYAHGQHRTPSAGS